MRSCRQLIVASLMASLAASAGCGHLSYFHDEHPVVMPPGNIPHELAKVDLATYEIEPPDIITIELLYALPKPPYRVKPQDLLIIKVKNILPMDPIDGPFPVDPDGTVNLGPTYGSVKVVGMTLADAKMLIEKSLLDKKLSVDPKAEVTLGESRGQQQVRGPHLVRPDGTISLGIYGDIRVRGMTIAMAKKAIETQLAKQLLEPEVTVDIAAYNSKVFYVILDGGGAGQQVVRLPVTGNDHVIDAISAVNGLSAVSDQDRIWVSRRTTMHETDEIYPVDWAAITQRGKSDTNYQLHPGDRVFVHSDHLVTFDTRLARLFAPLERIFGVTLLGSSTVNSLNGRNNNGNNNNP